jgi:putative flippase GtrA
MTHGGPPSPVSAIRRWSARYWPRHREKAIYLVVGGWNTLFAFGSFSVLYYILQERLASSVVLALAYVVASVNGYLTFRYLVFAPVRHPVVEYLRYQAVYLPILGLNLIALPLALMYTNLSAYVIQALLAIFAVIAAYVGSKYFAFRKPKTKE